MCTSQIVAYKRDTHKRVLSDVLLNAIQFALNKDIQSIQRCEYWRFQV